MVQGPETAPSGRIFEYARESIHIFNMGEDEEPPSHLKSLLNEYAEESPPAAAPSRTARHHDDLRSQSLSPPRAVVAAEGVETTPEDEIPATQPKNQELNARFRKRILQTEKTIASVLRLKQCPHTLQRSLAWTPLVTLEEAAAEDIFSTSFASYIVEDSAVPPVQLHFNQILNTSRHERKQINSPVGFKRSTILIAQ